MPSTSPRSQIAERIANFIRCNGLTVPFGGEVGKIDQRFYEVAFARPRTLDGVVKIYGPAFIMIDTRGPLGKGRRVFRTEQHALDFLHLAFVKLDADAAELIPTKK